ncbi:MAG: 16S rRNA (guanine(527)-N(7))-methyltransferase RsmG [Opitutales bacterium]
MSESAIAAALAQPDPATLERLERYAALLRDCNQRINLVSRKDIDNLEARHLAPCVLPARFLTLAPGARVLDVGTGGGLPGLVLAVLYPHVEFLLVDAVAKKVAAVQEMAEALELPNVQTDQLRVQHLRKGFDFVVGRAVTNLADFLDWTLPRVKPDKGLHSLANGVLYWKGGDLEPELAERGRQPAQLWKFEALLPGLGLDGKYIAYFPANNVRT